MIRRLLICRQDMDKTAVIENGAEQSYQELLHKAQKIARLLPDARGRVALLLPDGGDYIAAFWGVLQAGATAFPLTVSMSASELLPLLRQASVHTVITRAEYVRILDGMEDLHVILTEDLDRSVSNEPVRTGADEAENDTMVLLGTSGTTGCSKIVCLSERNVETAALGYLDIMRYSVQARYILAAPFSSVYGLLILSACLLRSFPVIVPGRPLTLDNVYKTAERHRATHYEGGAALLTLMEQMAGRPVPYDISTLTYIGFGGSKVPGETIDGLYRAYPNMVFFQGYGMTESAAMIAKQPLTPPVKTDSVGRAIQDVEIAVDTENGLTAAPFVEGEIAARGPNIMQGYLDNRPETERVLKNGWLYTGDMGYLDEGGYLFIIGRKKNIIIVRGFNVYPEEVEACIKNSGLALDCLVYGQSDGHGGETVCADIVPQSPDTVADDIRVYCRAHLADYKQPHHISFCGSLRRTANGKLERA